MADAGQEQPSWVTVTRTWGTRLAGVRDGRPWGWAGERLEASVGTVVLRPRPAAWPGASFRPLCPIGALRAQGSSGRTHHGWGPPRPTGPPTPPLSPSDPRLGLRPALLQPHLAPRPHHLLQQLTSSLPSARSVQLDILLRTLTSKINNGSGLSEPIRALPCWNTFFPAAGSPGPRF